MPWTVKAGERSPPLGECGEAEAEKNHRKGRAWPGVRGLRVLVPFALACVEPLRLRRERKEGGKGVSSGSDVRQGTTSVPGAVCLRSHSKGGGGGMTANGNQEQRGQVREAGDAARERESCSTRKAQRRDDQGTPA